MSDLPQRAIVPKGIKYKRAPRDTSALLKPVRTRRDTGANPVLVGNVYERLTVLRIIPDGRNPKAECRCECGTIVTPQKGALRNGSAKSCGCLRREKLLAAAITHGASKSNEYKIYTNIRNRCCDSKNKHYKNYGGRGIGIGYKSFEEFIADVGPRPKGMWLDRLDNNKGYEPGNCKWVTPRENACNKRVSKIWIINGVEYNSSIDAAKAVGVHPSVIIRKCNGAVQKGRYYPPREGWSCRLKYAE